ncbi:MAG: NlpC/P60 family protein [Sporichthyaceae bacterium]
MLRHAVQRAASRLATAVALVAAGSLTLGVLATPATAEPTYPSAREVQRSRSAAASTAASVGQTEARLAAASARSAQLATEVAQAVEAYNGARFRLAEAIQAGVVAQRKAEEAQREVDAARRELGKFAAAAYREGGDLVGLSAFLSSKGPQDLIDRASAIDSIGTSRRRALATLRSAEVAAGVLQQRARHLVAARADAAAAVEAAKVAAEGKLAAQQQALTAMASERRLLIAALAKARSTTVRLERARQAGLEQARAEQAIQAQQRRAAQLRRVAARAKAVRDKGRPPGGSSSGGSKNGAGGGGAPSGGTGGSSAGTSSGASAAIAFARAQIGKSYEWAATGPNTFDCSGLTMRAWERGGVSLPHYSVAQYEQGRKVAISDLRRGDLIFFGSDPGNPGSIYHVGLYIGGGQMIEAPYTGEDVRISSIFRDSLFGAARP